MLWKYNRILQHLGNIFVVYESSPSKETVKNDFMFFAGHFMFFAGHFYIATKMLVMLVEIISEY